MVASMRLFPGMRARMDRQGTALDKALVAVCEGAIIGSLVGMYPIMPAEV